MTVVQQAWQEAVFVAGDFRRPEGGGTLAPFGGMRQSALGGRSGGDANIEEFTERRWLTVNSEPGQYPY